MKLSEYKNEEAIELFADILDPAISIFGDKAVVGMIRGNKNRMEIVKYILKNYSKDIVKILAAMDRTPVEEFECTVYTLPGRIMEILSDKEMMSFFSSVAGTEQENTSGSATENTKAKEKIS